MGPSRPSIFLPLFLSVLVCMSASLGSASSDLVSEYANSVRSTIDVVQQVATLISTFAEFANSVRLTIEVVPQVASLVSTFTEFANAVRLTIEVVQQVASLVSTFTHFAISVRLTIEVVRKVASLVSRFARAFSEAIADCLDLLDLSAANSVFMNEMQNFTTLIVDMVKKEGLFASQGGPIILAQIENEYGNVISSYGYAGKAYRDWCANMAISQSIGVPWIMCQESDAPEPMINTCNGWYCDQFTPNRPSSPKMWTENWTGLFKNWGGLDPHRTAEDLAFSIARFFQAGGTFQNYYMYHGGTNFGRTAGGPYITTSYDYDAPLDEYGGLNQPKYGHLKRLHNVLKSMERTLTHGNITTNDLGNMVSNEMQNFTTLIVDMVKKEALFASQGGPIILAQIENEYVNVISSYGYAGKAYRDWCANMAISQSIGVPWIMCQESDAPEPMINTCNGWYCDQFTPNRPSSPKMWTENWTGWFKNWGGLDPHRTAEDLAFSVARFFQTGGTFQNYYVYHGGTNFGRTAGGPYITTSYDYDAPLDEYGGLNQPKYGHLKRLHNVLKSIERTLTHGNITTNDLGNMVSVTIYATNETSSCFFGNANDSSDATVTFQGNDYNVPAWSVSILPDCKNEVYNTAKVNTQTSVMVKKTNEAENEPSALNWSWRPENTDKTIMLGQGHVSKTQLLDQKFINDVSDYLWYMTSVHIKKDDPIHSHNISIRVNGTGQVLHAYINGEYIGSEWATYGIFHYFFEKNIKLKQGKNQITLLSATIGLQNYGPQFDKINTGIPSPVQLIGRNGDETIIKDLSSHKSNYRVGLHGLNDELFSSDSRFAAKWQSDNLPTNQRMMWYKTTFQAPLGTDPVVVDMQGMGKGMAWVNGQSIGRYWPSYLAKEDGCSLEACDYRGTYDNNKCVTNCGQPTQRWYHVPRSFIPNDVNTLVLFEEFGGNPAQVNFQTVAPGTVCGNAYEKNNMELSCKGRPISDIRFASFGDVKGTCGSFKKGSCEGGNNPIDILKTACHGKVSCSIQASDDVFGKSNYTSGTTKRLVVEAVC